MTPMITLDMKKNRIRIHKATLRLLMNPKFIHILINPEKNTIAICPSLHKGRDTLSVSCRMDYDCELYSKDLMYQLSTLKPGINANTSYRIAGIMDEENIAVVFDISNTVPVKEKEHANDI